MARGNHPPKEPLSNFGRRRGDLMRALSADRHLSATAHRVAGALAFIHMNAEHGGKAWPSVSTLSGETGACVRAVRMALGELIERGYLAAETRHGESTVYRIGDKVGIRIKETHQKADRNQSATIQKSGDVHADNPGRDLPTSTPATPCRGEASDAPAPTPANLCIPPRQRVAAKSSLRTQSINLSYASLQRDTRANEPSTVAKVGSAGLRREEAAAIVETVASAEPIASAIGSAEVSPPIVDQPATPVGPQGSSPPDGVVDVDFVEVTASGGEPSGGPELTPEPEKPAKAPKASRKSAKAATEAEAFTILRECLSAETARDVIEHRLAKRKPLKTTRAARELAKAFVESGNPEKAAAKMIREDWTGFDPKWKDCTFEPDVPPIEETLIRGALCAVMTEQTAGAVLAHLVAKGARITTSPQAEKLAKAFVESGDTERAAAKMIERGWKSFDPTWPGCNFTQPQQGPAQQHYGAPQSSRGRFNAASAQIDRQMAEYAKNHAPKF